MGMLESLLSFKLDLIIMLAPLLRLVVRSELAELTRRSRRPLSPSLSLSLPSSLAWPRRPMRRRATMTMILMVLLLRVQLVRRASTPCGSLSIAEMELRLRVVVAARVKTALVGWPTLALILVL
jgi:hypothetical protein